MTGGSWSKPANVLVTGGTGFVGTYVCRLLATLRQRSTAMALEPFSPEALFTLGDEAALIRYAHGDVCDATAMDEFCAAHRPDAIIHAAGLVGHDASLADPRKAYAINVGGTVNILEAARKAKVSKVVLVSSNAVYHKRERDRFDETHAITSIETGNPNAHYGASKMAGEQAGLVYYTYSGLDVVAVRITSVYGFGMKSGQMQLKQMVENAAAGRPVLIASGGPVPRDYTYVEDAATGIVDILNFDTSSLKQRVYNISRGELTTNFDIAESVRAAVPGAAIEVGGEMSEFDRATLKQRAPLDSQAAAIFGYRSRYSLHDGIRLYVTDFLRYTRGLNHT